jgi:hypothetical protein
MSSLGVNSFEGQSANTQQSLLRRLRRTRLKRMSYVSTRSFMFMVSAYGGSGVGILEGTFFTQRAKRRESGVM